MQPLFLIGYRATGKSTVGRLVAEKLGWQFVDADDEVERRAGCSIADIFATRGEGHFRDLESTVVAELAQKQDVVVSLGGGAVVRAENRAALAGRGPIVWLTAPAETIERRLAGDAATAARRPNLTVQGGHSEIETLLAARTPLYAACADVSFDAAVLSPAEIAARIIAWLEQRPTP